MKQQTYKTMDYFIGCKDGDYFVNRTKYNLENNGIKVVWKMEVNFPEEWKENFVIFCKKEELIKKCVLHGYEGGKEVIFMV